jgi:hypothetical protein
MGRSMIFAWIYHQGRKQAKPLQRRIDSWRTYGAHWRLYAARITLRQRGLDDELTVLHALSVAYPLIFLSVAAFMVNAVLAQI